MLATALFGAVARAEESVLFSLGRSLFHDERLSFNQTISCASCHQPDRAFTDGRRTSIGASGETLSRNAMSLVNLVERSRYGWSNPEADTLGKQMAGPLLNQHPVELGWLEHEPAILERLSNHADYQRRFSLAYPDEADPVTRENVIEAITRFESELVSDNSAFDRWFRQDQRPDQAVIEGFRLFTSDTLGCARCHAGTRFTNETYVDIGLGGDDPGLAAATGNSEDHGKFMVPTLRNIAVTAPYMHDGRFETLDEVIDHYAGGPRREEGLTGFTLSPRERGNLEAFLHSLTDKYFLSNPRFRRSD